MIPGPAAPQQATSPIAVECGATEAALVVTLDGEPWPDRAREALESQIAIEATRLSLIACRSSVSSPRARVRATLDAEGIRVEVTTSTAGTTRRLERVIPRARLGAPELLTELAFVIGELAREALRAPAPVPAAAPRTLVVVPRSEPRPLRDFGLGARGQAELFAANGTVFVGLDVYGRRRWADRWIVELSASGRMSPPGNSALGTASSLAIGGGLSLALELWSSDEVAILAELGARAGGVRVSAEPAIGAIADPARWDAQAHALGGLELDYFVTPQAPLVLRLGATFALRGVTVLAETEEVLSPRGAGLFVSLGSEGWF